MTARPLRSPALLAWLLPAVVAFTSTTLGTGCTETTSHAALGISVRVAPSVKAQCVRVWVRPADGAEQVTEPIAVNGRSELEVAVYANDVLNGDVQVGARGYLGPADCSTATAHVPNEESPAINASFVQGDVAHVVVALDAVPEHLDVDTDGYRGAAFGGVDCLDDDEQIHPGAEELCGDAKDNDCSGFADCADATCQSKSCSEGDACTGGGVCDQGACVGAQPVLCQQTQNPCLAQMGTCAVSEGGCQFSALTGQGCPGGFCSADGVCVPAGTEVDCADGIDNNGIDGADCADSTCDARACDSGDLCRPTATCGHGACVPGPAKTCVTPPSECHQMQGTCDSADGACDYALKPAGSPCSLGECLASGQCVASETGAQCSDGSDNDGDGTIDCDDPSCAQQACDPQNQCTVGRTCQSGACAGGSAVMCNPPVCFASAVPACDPATGCEYVPTPGAACPGGFCSSAGTCVPPFSSYTPSNFNPLDYPPATRTSSLTFDCGQSGIESDTGFTGASRFVNWCGNPEPTLFPVMQSNGLEALVVAVDSLTVTSGNSIAVYGNRPVIFAVYGDATIAGRVLVGGAPGINGAGARWALCTGSVGDDGASGTTANGGGGGGGFATAGAPGGDGDGAHEGGSEGAVLSNLNLALVPLRGGCSGGFGGNGNGGTNPSGIIGGGGGAVQISASGSLSLSGRISAVGGGGGGGVYLVGGGGGGGSGGGILLEGNTIHFTASAIVAAAGGGGGEGASTMFHGNDGSNGRAGTTTGAAPGGSGGSYGGNGGNGSWASTDPGVGLTGSASGGGGGGGLGVIRINAAAGCTTNPDASFRGVVSSSGMNCPCPGSVNHGVCG